MKKEYVIPKIQHAVSGPEIIPLATVAVAKAVGAALAAGVSAALGTEMFGGNKKSIPMLLDNLAPIV